MRAINAIFALLLVAVLINPASAGIVFGDGGASLQGALDDITLAPVANDSSIDVTTDYLQDANDSFWSVSATGGSVSTVIIEIAGFAGTNKFGIYDRGNTANFVELFDGAATTGSQALLSIHSDGSVYVNFGDTGMDFAGNSFGFYLDSSAEANGGVFYSDTSQNSDGLDHMAAYQGLGVDTVQIGTLAAGLWTTGEYVLAFEDLVAGVSDNDYSDFVVMVESINPVPEPAAMLVWGFLGTIGLCWLRRRRQA